MTRRNGQVALLLFLKGGNPSLVMLCESCLLAFEFLISFAKGKRNLIIFFTFAYIL